MKCNPYLNFNGTCAEAFALYSKLLGGKVEGLMTFRNSPMAGDVGPEWQDKVMHAVLHAGDVTLMGSDAPTQHYRAPGGFGVAMMVGDRAKAESLFNALAEGGKVGMPFGKTFWSAGFGMVTDRFGTPWIINSEPA